MSRVVFKVMSYGIGTPLILSGAVNFQLVGVLLLLAGMFVHWKFWLVGIGAFFLGIQLSD